MLMQCLQMLTLLTCGLLAGAVTLVWLGDRPFLMSPGFYIAFQHARIAALMKPMPILGLGAAALALALAVASWGRPIILPLRLAAAICLLLGNLVTVFGNVPINNQILQWTPENYPADWTLLRDRWWRCHELRTLLAIAAFAALQLSALL